MRKIKFIHLSDIHIGLQTHGKINPATGKNTRLEDIVKSLDFVFDYALKESVDLVLIAGDIFHRENPHPTEEIEFARRVVNLVEKSRTKVVMVLGNHDYPSAGGKASAVEIFPALDIEGVTIVRKPGLHTLDTENGQVQIACLPWA
ncbi:MAG: exonuclease subunit SbcD, partial [Thermodesulfobacteriota bacterium]